MVRIKLISDIHIDSYNRDLKGIEFVNSISNKDVDILVVAGDIITNGYLEKYYDLFKLFTDRFEETVFVLGNHDHYRHSMEEVRDIMGNFQTKLSSNFHWLDNTKKEIKGVQVIGGTLWFPEVLNLEGKANWVDFRYVSGGCWPIFEEFRKTKEFFSNNVNEKSIVVSHHMPSYRCVNHKYIGDSYNCFFVGDVEDVIQKNKPKLWLYGHTHDPAHLMIGDTELFCNPRGYPNEGVSFDPNLIIDTDLDSKI